MGNDDAGPDVKKQGEEPWAKRRNSFGATRRQRSYRKFERRAGHRKSRFCVVVLCGGEYRDGIMASMTA
jgi:hypothetical protein